MTTKVTQNGPVLSPRQPASTAFAARFQLEHEHWRAVLAHIEEPATAQLIVDLFRTHPHLQASHPAVYLRAMHCIQRAETSAAKAKAAGRTFRLVGSTGAAAVRLVATSAVHGTIWALGRMRKARQSVAQASAPSQELTWPVLMAPDA